MKIERSPHTSFTYCVRSVYTSGTVGTLCQNGEVIILNGELGWKWESILTQNFTRIAKLFVGLVTAISQANLKNADRLQYENARSI